jgi:hypothetical protein
LAAAACPFFFQKVNHARRPEFAVEFRILAPQAGVAHIHPVFFTTVGLSSPFRIPATVRHWFLPRMMPSYSTISARPMIFNPFAVFFR